jgi:cytochrome c553
MLRARSSGSRTSAEPLRLRGIFAACLSFLVSAAAHAADAQAGEAKSQVCVACHGPGGDSTDPQFPSLAAQPPIYVFYQLIQFREQRRKDPRMSPFAEKLTNADMKDMAAYFAAQKAPRPTLAPVAARVAAGKAVVERNHCGSCHTSTFAGQNHIARLAGQHYEYLVKELRGFKTGARPDIDGTMASAAQPLSEEDIVNVAHYLATSQVP